MAYKFTSFNVRQYEAQSTCYKEYTTWKAIYWRNIQPPFYTLSNSS